MSMPNNQIEMLEAVGANLDHQIDDLNHEIAEDADVDDDVSDYMPSGDEADDFSEMEKPWRWQRNNSLKLRKNRKREKESQNQKLGLEAGKKRRSRKCCWIIRAFKWNHWLVIITFTINSILSQIYLFI